MIIGHGGNIDSIAAQLGCTPEEILDMSSNVNPLGPPAGLFDFLIQKLNAVTLLPQADAQGVIEAFAEWHGLDPDRVLAGNGSTQLIYTLPLALNSRRVLILGPTYADYADACAMYQIDYEYLLAHEADDFIFDLDRLESHLAGFDTVFICNPNNPTGTLFQKTALEALCRAHPQTFFVIDESYLPFVVQPSGTSLLGADFPNVGVINSLSKIFRISGLRIGFFIARPEIIQKLSRYRLPWSVNSLAQAAVGWLARHSQEMEAFVDMTKKHITAEKRFLHAQFESSSHIKLYPSQAPFVLARLAEGYTAQDICCQLLKHRILLRNCDNFSGLSERFIRISLKLRENNGLLAEKLQEILGKAP